MVSTQHVEDLEQAEIKRMLWPIVKSTLPDGWMCPEAEFHVNPTGKFVTGGPDGDCGLTGRKIIVDTYGGAAPHGGGAFSGKDPTKVDRSAAYACRYLAKNVVAAGLADRCTIQISYAIGIARPLSVYVDLQNTGKDVDEARLERTLRELMNLTPRGIREHLHLNRPIYVPTSAYGHFGREPDGGQGHLHVGEDRPGAGAEGGLRALIARGVGGRQPAPKAAAGPAVRPGPRSPAAAAPASVAGRHPAAAGIRAGAGGRPAVGVRAAPSNCGWRSDSAAASTRWRRSPRIRRRR